MVQRQGGDVSYLEDTRKFTIAPAYPVLAPKDGFIAAMQTEEIGAVAGMLGAGREKRGMQSTSRQVSALSKRPAILCMKESLLHGFIPIGKIA